MDGVVIDIQKVPTVDGSRTDLVGDNIHLFQHRNERPGRPKNYVTPYHHESIGHQTGEFDESTQ